MELTLPVRNPVFYIFDVSGGKLPRNHLKICGGHFLGRRRLAGEGSMRIGQGGLKEDPPRGQIPWPRERPPFGPYGPNSFHLRLTDCVLT